MQTDCALHRTEPDFKGYGANLDRASEKGARV